ncbi:T9SS type A sorting domain-containing protein [Dyadobacter fermentans]|uniref:Secretion system C-terminal sorting domain-containing protein n=1 Tax=Dyadobacter fermentans (strain ATCC 700827 / DSM 18053 / CIP 107007 / KCTC 52180 / NS114) TaxID=471854 RepID=C6VRZ8_DYAFD|nr:T9SS type A sorting domain-containing protein [Dyadobacter fermentans]ACT94519.1 hypothetical protein Dfer_3308 [Dyadobacter fermentans DSM 18053]
MKIKVTALVMLMIVGHCVHNSYAQDLDINLDPQQASVLDKTYGALEVKICNCHTANITAPANKARPLISFPDNLIIENVTNPDGSAITDFSVQKLSNDPGDHGVRLLLNTPLANTACASFLINVKGNGVGDGPIIATLGFMGPQTVGNLTANDNAVAALPVMVNFPVELDEFSVKKEENTAILEWSTAVEINSSQFDVQRSSDGHNWRTLASVTAKGNSQTQVRYSARDTDPLNGENLYRLHMIDTDGSSTYSMIRNLRFEFEPVAFFPNPARDMLQIKTSDWSKIQQISIKNTKGQAVYISAGSKARQIDLSSLKVGIYILEILTHNGEINTYRIAIAK